MPCFKTSGAASRYSGQKPQSSFICESATSWCNVSTARCCPSQQLVKPRWTSAGTEVTLIAPWSSNKPHSEAAAGPQHPQELVGHLMVTNETVAFFSPVILFIETKSTCKTKMLHTHSSELQRNLGFQLLEKPPRPETLTFFPDKEELPS